MRARTASLAVPAWVWLAGLVALSAGFRYGLGRRMVAPWIMIDELVYSELAKSLAETGSFLIRDEPAGGAYGVVYPALIAPAFALFESIPDAYAAAKAINAVVISLAALPAYLLARRVLAPGLSLVAAGLTLALPSLLYAGTLMTENAFFPLFLTAALALVLTLERPTPARVLVFLLVTALAFATRAQAVVLLPALLTAPLLLVAFGRRGLAAYRWLYALPAAAGLGLVLVQLARGSSPLALLGAYRVTGEERYDLTEVARWLLYHVAELDLSLGVIPFASLLLLVLLARRLDRREQVFVAAAVSLSAWLLVQVAAFASRHSLRVEERNMFYLAPLFLIALLLWIQLGLPRPRRALLAAGAAAVLPALLPFATLIGVSAVSDTFGLLAWWTVHEWGIALDRLWIAVLAAAAAAAAMFLLVPRRYALALPGLLLAFFLVSSQPVEERIRTASIGALFQGVTAPERDWIDRAVGPDGEVAALWSGRLDQLTVLENEFFNRSVGRVYTLRAPLPAGLAQAGLVVDPQTGVLEGPVRSRYALADDSIPLSGRRVARDPTKGLAVYDTFGEPLRVRWTVLGAYDDAWTGRRFTWRGYRCREDALRATFESDPNLFSRPQSVTARVDGRVAGRVRVPPAGRASLDVPLRPLAGRCDVSFTVAQTAVPADLQPGSADTRRLGIRVAGFAPRS